MRRPPTVPTPDIEVAIPNSCMTIAQSKTNRHCRIGRAEIANAVSPVQFRTTVRFRTRSTTTTDCICLISRNILPRFASITPGQVLVCPRGTFSYFEARDMLKTVGPHLVYRVCAVDAAGVPQRCGRTRVHGVDGHSHQLGAAAGLEHHHFICLVAADAGGLRAVAPLHLRPRQLETFSPHPHCRQCHAGVRRSSRAGAGESLRDLDQRAHSAVLRARAVAHLYGHSTLLVCAADYAGHRVLRQVPGTAIALVATRGPAGERPARSAEDPTGTALPLQYAEFHRVACAATTARPPST